MNNKNCEKFFFFSSLFFCGEAFSLRCFYMKIYYSDGSRKKKFAVHSVIYELKCIFCWVLENVNKIFVLFMCFLCELFYFFDGRVEWCCA